VSLTLASGASTKRVQGLRKFAIWLQFKV